MQIGFLGLGQMGSAIAERLQAAGARLHIFDPSEVATAPFVLRGAVDEASVQAVADAAEVVAAGSDLFSRHMDPSAVAVHQLSWPLPVRQLPLVVSTVTAVMMKQCSKLSLVALSPKLTLPIPLRTTPARRPTLAGSRTGRLWQTQIPWEWMSTSTLTTLEVCKVILTS